MSGETEYCFAGHYDGNGYTIRGLYSAIHDLCYGQGGLFHSVKGTICNLNIEDSYVETYSTDGMTIPLGVLANQIEEGGVISNVHVKNCILVGMGGQPCGGLVGQAISSSISNCSFEGTIDILDYSARNNSTHDTSFHNQDFNVGGIVGFCNNKSQLSNLQASGNINVTVCCTKSASNNLNCIGGIAGRLENNVVLNNLTNKTTIEVKSLDDNAEFQSTYIGGIAGYFKDGAKLKCIANLGNVIIGRDDGEMNVKDIFVYAGITSVFNSSSWYNDDIELYDCVSYGRFTAKGRMNAPGIYFNGGSFLDSGEIDLYTEFNWIVTLDCQLPESYNTVYFHPNLGGRNGIEDIDIEHSNYNLCHSTLETNSSNAPSISSYNGTYPIHPYESGLATLDYMKHLAEGTGIGSPDLRYGVYRTTDDLNDLPLMVNCGGVLNGLVGKGTAVEPYSIKSTYDLRKFVESINKGETTDGIYYSLDADIEWEPYETLDRASNDEEHAFKGTFDGHGHTIHGLRTKGSLFRYFYGTVQNLTLSDFRNVGQGNHKAAIATYVKNGGTIKDCSVSGVLSVSRGDPYVDEDVQVAGVADAVYENSSIENCSFKGTFEATPKTTDGQTVDAKTRLFFNGICHTVYGTVKGCYASYRLRVDGEFTPFFKDDYQNYLYGKSGLAFAYPNDNKEDGIISDCAFVCPELDEKNYTTQGGVTRLTSDQGLTPTLLGDKAGDHWQQGAFRPVLKSCRTFSATDAEGYPRLFDLCPDDAWTMNKVFNHTLAENSPNLNILLSFNNLELYNATDKSAFITNLRIDRSGDKWDYKPSSTKGTISGNVEFTFKQEDSYLSGNPKNKFLVCLPFPLRKTELPEGTELYALCYFEGNENYPDNSVFYLSERDSIAGGVPCHVYIPSAKDGDVTIRTTGMIASQPVNTLTSQGNGVKGYYEKTTLGSAYTKLWLDEDIDSYKRPSEIGIETNVEVKTFGVAGLSDRWADQRLLVVREIDENDPYIQITINSLLENPISKDDLDSYDIYLRRNLTADKWQTLCLPFDYSIDLLQKVWGKDLKVEALTSIDVDANGNLALNFTALAENGKLEAGKPYLIRPSQSAIGMQLGFIPTIKATPTPTTCQAGGYEVSMVPCYTPRQLALGEYFIQDDHLYLVSRGAEVNMKGMRAFFTTNEAASASLSQARIFHDDGSTTPIQEIDAPDTDQPDVIYDLQGRRVKKPTQGLYIVNGRKVFLKGKH